MRGVLTLALLSLVAMGVLFGFYAKKPKNSFSFGVDYDIASRQLLLHVKNETNEDLLFDLNTALEHRFKWLLCSGKTVIRDQDGEANQIDALVPIDRFPVVIRAHRALQIDLTQHYKQLGTGVATANADCFLWHCSTWDAPLRKWTQTCGQVRLR